MYAPNSMPSKDVDFYNQIYELMRKKMLQYIERK